MSTMITGERRGVRRGMTVLGKVPAVPRPINLPSQRLENRGLDPNVEIVPRGTVTWGNAARSPPTANSNWGGSGSQPSSPPVSTGAWGKPATAWGSNSARPSSAGSTRPASGGSSSSGAPRPSSSGGRHPQDLPRPSSAGNQDVPPQNAWGPNSRPQSASGPQPSNTQQAGGRPRSAEAGPNGRASLLSSELSHAPPAQPWGPSGSRKQPEDGPQPSRFTLSNGDFPSLGSEKNPNLRPQQRERSEHAEEERPPTSHAENYYYEDGYPQGSRFNDADANVWPGGPGHFRPPMEGGYGMPSNSWRREPHERPDGEDHWPPNGPFGPPRFPNPDFLPQRFGPGPGSYGRGQPGDGYGPPPFMRPMNPERPQFAPGMFPGPYEGYYGYPGYDERGEMMMWPAGPGYGFHPDFPRHPMGPRPRHMPNHPGFGKDAEGFHPEYRPSGKLKEGEPRPDGHPEFRREPSNKHGPNEPKRSVLPRPHGQRDWGNEEPMDFTRPVFEKEPTPTKNPKVSFKSEPTVADVAILKKPKPIEDTGDVTRTDEESKADAGSSGQVSADKDSAETSAGVLGKAPPSATLAENDKQVLNRSSAEPGSKDVFRPKPKLSVQDSEKEWRPKAHGDASKTQDENDAEYDYEAQRAKMKEIAAQRARQLQREEEERTKEQKAKALAKLEELNRRSATVPADSPAPVEQEEFAPKMIEHTEMQFGTYQSGDLTQEVKIVPVPHPGKRNDRKASRGREDRGKAQQKKEIPATQAPDTNLESQPCSSAPALDEETKDVQPPPQPQTQHRQPRQRGGQRGKGRHLGKLEAEKIDALTEQVAPVDTAPLDSDSPTPAVDASISGNGPTSHRRKKSNRSSKNRHKNEVAQSQALEKSSSGEIHDMSDGLKVSNEKVGVEASSHSEGGESTTVDAGDTLPEEKTSSKGNTRRFPKRFSSKRSKPQDVRVGDKAHPPEGLRWTPVRSSGPRNEVSPDSNGEKNEAAGHHQPKSRRAEMARYTPKPVQQQGQSSNTEDYNEHAQGKRFEGQGSETFQKPGRSWRQRGGDNHQGFRNHDKERQRENGLIYQQKSGGRDITQDPGVSSSDNHQRPPYRQFSSDAHHKTQYQPVHPKNDWSVKSEQGSSSQWTTAEGKDFRARDSGHPRRGRFGARGGGRSVVDVGARVEKPRMVIDATGGAVPSQVVS